MSNKIKIEIDGRPLEVEQGSMVIEAADQNHIHIPRFCYHKKLSVAANCRMCLVEVEKSGKPLPACATPVTEGMIVRTRSKKALEAQRAVMEFLLLNHPLDCPICDQGGECELQDLAMGYGKDVSRYAEGKRAVKDHDIGPLIATEMTRCIHCTRCVRFGEEVAGLREMGGMGRGEHTEIGTYIEHSLSSEIAGNVIDLCPVGALTSKPFRFQARAWELKQSASISPHDAWGSPVFVHTRRGEVMRVVPREDEHINESWISDRDRFSYTALKSPDRLKAPKIKRDGEWVETTWSVALEQAAAGLQHVIEKSGASALAGIAHPSSTLEELYLFQKIIRALGSANVDHRLHQVDFSDQDAEGLFPGLNTTIESLEKADRIFLIGSNIHHEMPLAGVRVRKATMHGARVGTLSVLRHRYNFDVKSSFLAQPQTMVSQLAGIAKAMDVQDVALNCVESSAEHKAWAEQLKTGERVMLILGAGALNHPQASVLRRLAQAIAGHCKGVVSLLTEGANAAGAWWAGVLPHRGPAGAALPQPGLTLNEFWKNTKAYVLLNVEPESDLIESARAMTAMMSADFIVALSAFESQDLLEVADVILPIAPFTETSGTFVNTMGEWQSFTAAAQPLGEVRPAWKVLRVLGNVLELEGFAYESSQDICNELKALPTSDLSISVHALAEDAYAAVPLPQTGLTRVMDWPLYRVDALVRRAEPLQKTVISLRPAVHLHPKAAERLALKEGRSVWVQQRGTRIALPLIYDDAVPETCAYIPAGFIETSELGAGMLELSLKVEEAK